MTKKEAKVLIIDDDYDVLKSAQVFLKRFFSIVQIEQIPENINRLISEENFDVILLDMNFKKGVRDGTEGFYWLNHILNIDKGAIVILITAYGDLDLAIKAIKAGAMDFVLKPWKNQKLLATIYSALQLRQSKNEINRLRITQQKLIDDANQNFGEFIGVAPSIKKVFLIIEKVAKTDADVLILGENGTGKELVARTIHKNSERKNNVFISVDLGALSESLFESELFGHVKGAFTDAKEDKPGRFELASGGTIFLDEIGNLSVSLQVKLLNVLQNRKVMRIGSVEEITVDFRLICATNMPLLEMVKEGNFREDLLYRINMVEISVPPLRERTEDIPLLFDFYFDIYKRKYKKFKLRADRKLINKLKKYYWPGNIREFQHAIERAVILNENNRIAESDFDLTSVLTSKQIHDEVLLIEEMEKKHILKVIDKNSGNITKSAIDLGISRTALHRRLNKYGL